VDIAFQEGSSHHILHKAGIAMHMKLIKSLKAERELALCCDIHGHNRKKNIFICKSVVSEMAARLRITPRRSRLSLCL
jgi:hypothetical protein